MKLLSVFLACATISLAAPQAGPKTEIGEINGAKFRIDIPENWNGGLVMYCHGYSPVAGSFKEGKLPEVLAVFTEQGYALAQSGYAAGGWAIQEAVEDTEALRRHFVTKYGEPKETFVTGHSMGGFLTMMFMERFPTTYDAGLALCGPLAPTTYFMERGAFDLRVVFDYYFPGALPRPDKVPDSYRGTAEETKRIQALLDSQPDKAAALMRYSGAHNTKDQAGTLTFVTYMLLDLQKRAGGNPFDNRNEIYEIPDNYNARERWREALYGRSACRRVCPHLVHAHGKADASDAGDSHQLRSTCAGAHPGHVSRAGGAGGIDGRVRATIRQA